MKDLFYLVCISLLSVSLIIMNQNYRDTKQELEHTQEVAEYCNEELNTLTNTDLDT